MFYITNLFYLTVNYKSLPNFIRNQKISKLNSVSTTFSSTFIFPVNFGKIQKKKLKN